MTSAMETALEMIEAYTDSAADRQIIGVYDAPIKANSTEANQPLSTLALTLAE